jgi:apolipoprotein D and lipocalin family protein
MHRVIAAALLLLLAACSGGGRETAAYRTPEAPIWSAAAFAPSQVTGRWQQVAAFAAEPGGCRGGAVTVDPAPGGFAVTGTLCLDGEARKIDALARPVGPGRLSVEGQEDWWVLWVDEGYRTLAVGTPSGRFGFVLDRGAIPQDRLAAAGEIFAFNGYRAGRLQPF